MTDAHRWITASGRKVTLNSVMQFDHVIRVNADGTVDNDPQGAHYVPELLDQEHTGTASGWEPLRGYSGQYAVGRENFIMHNSEFIGGGMADDILSTPGLYVAVVAEWSCGDDCEPDCNGDHSEGWAVFTICD